MRRRAAGFVLVMLLVGISFGSLAATITVPDDYPSIQAAIDAARAGDTVFVKAGEYVENLTIRRPLRLVGEGRSTVRIQPVNTEAAVILVSLEAGELEIIGVSVRGSENGIAIYVDSGATASVSGVVVVENGVGVSAQGEGSVSISKSLFAYNGVGVHLRARSTELYKIDVGFSKVGILLDGDGTTTIVGSLIGIAGCAIDTHAIGCGWIDGAEDFKGKILGEANRVFGTGSDLYRPVPGAPWPEGFFDEGWRAIIADIDFALSEATFAKERQDFKAACAAYLRGLALFADKKIAFPLLEGIFWHSIGIVYGSLSQYEEALAAFEEARPIYVARAMELDVARIDQNVGVIYSALARYEEALNKYGAARAVYIKNGMEIETAWIDGNVAGIHEDLGQYGEALDAYEAVRAVYVKNEMPTYSALIDLNIGNIYEELGRYEEALDRYEAARAIYIKREMEANVAQIEHNIGDVYGALGRYVEALAKYEDARAVYCKREMQVDIADVDFKIGLIYKNLGRPREALAKYEEVLAVLDGIPPLQGMLYSHPSKRWLIYSSKGIAYEDLNEWSNALKSYEDAIAVIESIRSGFTSEDLKLAWQERTQDVYERLIDLLYRMGEGASAFTYAERCRARTFLDALYQGSIMPNQLISPEAGISTGAVDPKAIDQAVVDARDSLQENEAVLEYMVTDGGVYLWVITKEGIGDPSFIEYERAQLMNDVITLRKTLESTNPDQITMTELFTSFYDKLVKESLAKLPDGVDTLILIPSGPLWYLPFSALVMTDQELPTGPGTTRHPYLVEKFTLAYLPSLASLSSLTKGGAEAAGGVRLLALVDPELSPDQLREGEGSKCGEEEPLGRYEQLVTACQDFAKRLVGEEQEEQCVYAGREAQEVRAHVDTGRQVIVYAAHGQFNPYVPLQSKLLLAPGGEAANPQTDSRVLDGNYHAWEALLTDYRGTELVILAACETLLPHLSNLKGTLAVLSEQECDQVELTPQQLEQIVVGDEVVGLARAFLSSGAEAVLGTLWLANPDAIGKLLTSMAEYHKNEGDTWVQAITKAQRELIKGTTFSNPWFWAPYQLIGRWR